MKTTDEEDADRAPLQSESELDFPPLPLDLFELTITISFQVPGKFSEKERF